MSGDAVSEGRVRAGDKVDRTTRLVLLVQKMEDSLVIREMGRIEGSECRYFSLDPGFASTREPGGYVKQAGRMFAEQKTEGIVKGVGLDQRSVQIHTERD